MTDRHTPRHERKPKPVKLAPAPWDKDALAEAQEAAE